MVNLRRIVTECTLSILLMAKHASERAFPYLFVLLILVSFMGQVQSAQVRTLHRIRHLLNYPPSLSHWTNDTELCNGEPTEAFTVVCYEDIITQLHIVGEYGTPKLPHNFSIFSFVNTLVRLPYLKVLTLVSLGLWGPLPSKFTRLSSLEILNLTSNFLQDEIPPSISSLTHLQTLILDSNNITGTLPDSLSSLSALAVLSVANNSFYGSLPHSLGNLESLRVLKLSNNKFSGSVPDLSSLTNLQVLVLENNVLGPRFPNVTYKIESIVLRNNRFTFGIPEKVQSCNRLKIFDVSLNRFVGPFPVSLLSLPSITYLDISENKFTGLLSENLPCNDELDFVNFTSNQLTGKLPRCLLSGPTQRSVLYAENCLVNEDENQRPISLCKNEALAVGNLPRSRKRKEAIKVIIALSICAGVTGGIVLFGAIFLIVKKFRANRSSQKPLPGLAAENASTGYTTQAMKLGAVGLPPYRTFSLEEIQEATDNFNTSAFMGEGSCGQMYRGHLRDGSYVAIKCLKLKRNHTAQYFMPQIEMISKLRHQHLVSALGHCFEYYSDDSSVSRVFLVFEYVPNGNLRRWISEKRVRRRLTWPQRIAAATGVAKGIQFIQTGIAPGLFFNNLKITDILLDQNLAAKISSYNLLCRPENMETDHVQNFHGKSRELTTTSRAKNQDKLYIYDFGVILLEVISGRPINSSDHVHALKNLLQASIMADDISRKSVVDPAVKDSCSGESLRTMIEICCRCMVKDQAERPSVDDVLWYLQYAAQVQDAWRPGDSQSSDGTPSSPLHSSHLRLTIK